MAINGELGLIVKSVYNFKYTPALFLGGRMNVSAKRYLELAEHVKLEMGFIPNTSHPRIFAASSGPLHHRLDAHSVSGICSAEIVTTWKDEESCKYDTDDISVIHDKLANIILEDAEVPRAVGNQVSGYEEITGMSVSNGLRRRSFVVSRKCKYILIFL